ncbi:MAG TPA: oxygenase MpaB family protein [Actinomycetota bacterium]
MQRTLPFSAPALPRVPALEMGKAGDPGLFGPTSRIWTIGRERALLLGGTPALLLQIAHPLVAAGVADHSDFRQKPYERLVATLDATLRITFGDTPQAQAAAEGVAATHRRVKGTLGREASGFRLGAAYDAADPELALWVHATLVETALQTYHRFVRPLSEAERERYFQEAKRFAALFGVGPDVMPPTYASFRGYFDSMIDGEVLQVTPVTRDLGWHVLNPPLPRPLRGATRLTRLAAAALLPPRLRAGYGLSWTGRDRAAYAAFTRTVRLALPLTPAPLRFWPHYVTARRRAGRQAGDR